MRAQADLQGFVWLYHLWVVPRASPPAIAKWRCESDIVHQDIKRTAAEDANVANGDAEAPRN
jgi:hypothetical protein